MGNNNTFNGLRKRDTYDSLTGYLDGGQERIKYPNRLATQLRISHELSDILDSEGKGWFEGNKEQMRRFTEQPVQDIVMKENLEEGETFQQQQILQQEDKRWQWQADRDEEMARKRESDAMVKEDGIAHMFKQNVKTKVAQEAATYVVKKSN